MKSYKKVFSVFIVSLFIGIASLTAQEMAPDNPPGDPDPGDDPIGGGGAPIGSGLLILLIGASSYALGKTYILNKNNTDK